MKYEEGCGAASTLCSFFLGAVVGAGLALLLAPLSGREVRQKISDYAEDVKEKAGDYAEETKTTASSKLHKGREFLEERKSVLTTALEEGKKAYDKEKGKYV